MRKLVYRAAASILLLAGVYAAHGAEGTSLPPPAGAALLLEAAADGVQIYACEAKEGGFEWVFKAPEANLFDGKGRQIGTHFGGPTWKANDGSAVVGDVVAKADAPAFGAIPWLLLRAKSDEGAGVLSAVAYIRRVETVGGIAPVAGCDSKVLSEQARVPYSAVYQFFSAAK